MLSINDISEVEGYVYSLSECELNEIKNKYISLGKDFATTISNKIDIEMNYSEEEQNLLIVTEILTHIDQRLEHITGFGSWWFRTKRRARWGNILRKYITEPFGKHE